MSPTRAAASKRAERASMSAAAAGFAPRLSVGGGLPLPLRARLTRTRPWTRWGPAAWTRRSTCARTTRWPPSPTASSPSLTRRTSRPTPPGFRRDAGLALTRTGPGRRPSAADRRELARERPRGRAGGAPGREAPAAVRRHERARGCGRDGAHQQGGVQVARRERVGEVLGKLVAEAPAEDDGGDASSLGPSRRASCSTSARPAPGATTPNPNRRTRSRPRWRLTRASPR